MKVLLAALFCLIAEFASASPPLLKDDFSDPQLAARRALRGDWKIADGIAACTQDDELFKRHKNHGPIIFYDVKHTDAAVSFAFKPDAAVKSVVFTANGEAGHVFRIVIGTATASVRAFPPEEKDHKSIALGAEPSWKLKAGEWTRVRVELRGPKAVVHVGEASKEFEHASIARPKANLSIGFANGSMSVKDWLVEQR
jgi:hypothetical protein